MLEQQSPINLVSSFRSVAPKGYLKTNWPTSIGGFRHQGAHGLEVVFPASNLAFIDLNGKRFYLRQLHFHHPSEHLVDANCFEGEVHIVHQNWDDASIAVLGVLLRVTAESTRQKDESMLTSAFGTEVSKAIPIKPQFWIPAKADRAFRYEGSLTTEPYTENVSWLVFHSPLDITPELFNAIFLPRPQSARGTQPINRRFVVDLDLKIERHSK